jgi:hypothetical protein
MTGPLEQCARAWRRLGVPRETAREMLDDLCADLAEARADGVSEAAFFGGDPPALARDWAYQRGVVRPRVRAVSTALVGLLGALPGVGFSLFVAYGISSDAIGEMFTTTPASLGPGDTRTPEGIALPSWLLLALYVVGGCFACAGALAAVVTFLGWRMDPARRVTRHLLTRVIPAGTVLAVAAAMAIAAWRDYSIATATVIAECASAALVFTLALSLGRLAAIRAWSRKLRAADELGAA